VKIVLGNKGAIKQDVKMEHKTGERQ